MNNQNHTPKHAGDVTKSLKKAAFSYISLFLIVMVLIGTTVSWFTVQDTANLKSDVMVFNSGTGLRVNDGEDITNHITIKDFKLDETSSVDGRNIFLPNGKLQSGVTGNMLYREATASDKNNKFMYADFKLKGESAGGIPVYIKSYKITIGNQVYDGSTEIHYSDEAKLKPEQIDTHPKCPLRIAFIEDSQDAPKVIDPSVLVDESVWNYNAVETVDSKGTPTSYDSNSGVKSFSHYYFTNKNGGEPLFNLNNSEAINATIVAWLEGTDDDETNENNSNAYAGKDISIDIELESNYEDMETITFVDDTKGDQDTSVKQWIGGGSCMITMTYTDVTTNIDGDSDKHPVRTVVMTATKWADPKKEHPIEWKAPIPKAVIKDITFNRYHYKKKQITSSDKNGALEEIYNAWYTNDRIMDMWKAVYVDGKHPVVELEQNKDLQQTRQFNGKNSLIYTATRGNGFGSVDVTDKKENWKRLSPCVGYWSTSSVPSTSETATNPTTTTVKPDYYNVTAILRILEEGYSFPNDSTSIRDHLRAGIKMYINFSDNTSLPMQTVGDNKDSCQWSGQLDIKSDPDIAVTGFSMTVGSKTYNLTVKNGGYKYTASSNQTFNVNSDGETVSY
ncbi:MAG: hypothetical protein PUE26_00695 [Ruminococcus sp.]|nr:hypothetical protein [Ruminococcus sp.]MDD6708666.1 hypothetical protein [Ruminococcus sp.]